MPKTAIIAIARILITAAIVFGFPYFLRQYLKRKDDSTKRIRILLIAYIIAVLIITLGIRSYDDEIGVITDLTWAYRQIFHTIHAGYEVGGLIEAIKRIHWVRGTISSLILNVFLFVPYGYLMPLVFQKMQKWWKVLLAGLTFSLCIETSQYLTHLGWFDISDPVYNGLGALIGYSLYKLIFTNSKTQCRREEQHGQ